MKWEIFFFLSGGRVFYQNGEIRKFSAFYYKKQLFLFLQQRNFSGLFLIPQYKIIKIWCVNFSTVKIRANFFSKDDQLLKKIYPSVIHEEAYFFESMLINFLKGLLNRDKSLQVLKENQLVVFQVLEKICQDDEHEEENFFVLGVSETVYTKKKKYINKVMRYLFIKQPDLVLPFPVLEDKSIKISKKRRKIYYSKLDKTQEEFFLPLLSLIKPDLVYLAWTRLLDEFDIKQQILDTTTLKFTEYKYVRRRVEKLGIVLFDLLSIFFFVNPFYGYKALSDLKGKVLSLKSLLCITKLSKNIFNKRQKTLDNYNKMIYDAMPFFIKEGRQEDIEDELRSLKKEFHTIKQALFRREYSRNEVMHVKNRMEVIDNLIRYFKDLLNKLQTWKEVDISNMKLFIDKSDYLGDDRVFFEKCFRLCGNENYGFHEFTLLQNFRGGFDFEKKKIYREQFMLDNYEFSVGSKFALLKHVVFDIFSEIKLVSEEKLKAYYHRWKLYVKLRWEENFHMRLYRKIRWGYLLALVRVRGLIIKAQEAKKAFEKLRKRREEKKINFFFLNNLKILQKKLFLCFNFVFNKRKKVIFNTNSFLKFIIWRTFLSNFCILILKRRFFKNNEKKEKFRIFNGIMSKFFKIKIKKKINLISKSCQFISA